MIQFITAHADTIGATLISTVFYLILGAMAYQRIKDRLDNHDDQIIEIKAEQKAVNPILLQIQLDIAEIKTTLKINR